MSDHVKGFVVVLANDIGEEDGNRVRDLLGLVKGVIEVRPVIEEPAVDYLVGIRVKSKLRDAILELLK